MKEDWYKSVHEAQKLLMVEREIENQRRDGCKNSEVVDEVYARERRKDE